VYCKLLKNQFGKVNPISKGLSLFNNPAEKNRIQFTIKKATPLMQGGPKEKGMIGEN